MTNSVNLTGALIKDPEPKTITVRDEPLTALEIRLAVRRPGSAKDAQKDYFTVLIYGSTADVVARYCAKGRRVGVTGRLKLEQWGDGDNRQSRTVIVADTVDIIDWPDRSTLQPAEPADTNQTVTGDGEPIPF